MKIITASRDIELKRIQNDFLKFIIESPAALYNELKNNANFKEFIIPSEIFGTLCLHGKHLDMNYMICVTADITTLDHYARIYAVAEIEEITK